MNNIVKIKTFFKDKEILEFIAVSIFFLVASCVFAIKTDLLNCGIHFADDYEIIDIYNFIKTNGLLVAIRNYVVDDLSQRFRPLYFVIRILRTYIFGDNYYYWHFLMAIETSLYISTSYIIARKLKISFIPSIIFSFVYLVGSQDEVIWRLGPQEPLALLFLTLAILFIVLYHGSKKKLYGTLATINIIFMVLYKESFLILSPAVILFLFYLELKDTPEHENVSIFKQLWIFINNHLTMILTTVASLVLSGATILFYTGLFDTGYAGIDSAYSFKDYIHLTLNVFIRDLKDYWILFGLMFIQLIYAMIKKIVKKEMTKQYLRYVFVGLVFAGYSMVAEAIIYGASSMFTRYYIPCVWILYFVVMVMEGNILKPIVNSAIAILLIVSSIYIYNQKECSVYMDGKCFADDGENITEMFNYTIEQTKVIKDAVVLTQFGWYEQNYCVSVYLQNKGDINSIYHLDEDREDGDYKNIYKDNGSRISFHDANIILTDDTGGYSEDKFDIQEFDNYAVLIKK